VGVLSGKVLHGWNSMYEIKFIVTEYDHLLGNGSLLSAATDKIE
jgi:hypothetical protein